MSVILITGANRGIGLELVRHYADDGWSVIACCRKPKAARALRALSGAIEIQELDVADDRSIERLAKALKRRSIDILLNNAGIYGKKPQNLGRTKTEDWLDVFRVNTIAPFRVTSALLPQILAGETRKIVAVTSRMGSIGDPPEGGSYAYRSSKAALNMVMANMASDLKGKSCALAVLHPGWVRTDMGGKSAPLSPQESAAGLKRVIAGLKPGPGCAFLAYDGKKLPW